MSRLKLWWNMMFVAIAMWVIAPIIALAQEVPADSGDQIPGLVDQLVQIISTPGPFRVIGAVAIIVTILMAILKSEKPPFNLVWKPPKVYLPFAAAGLGIIIAVLESIMGGTPIVTAIISGVLSGALSAFGYDMLKAHRKDPKATDGG